MNVIKTDLDGVLILEPNVFEDERGFFMESFNADVFRDAVGEDFNFVQDNHSRSSRGVLRGIHYQIKQAQGKLVRVVNGAVFDVAVDLRKSSSNFGKWVGVELSEENRRQFWVPPGFGHAFLALSEKVDFLYKTTDFYAPKHERGIIWSDPDINVDWPEGMDLILSGKDQEASRLRDAEVYA